MPVAVSQDPGGRKRLTRKKQPPAPTPVYTETQPVDEGYYGSPASSRAPSTISSSSNVQLPLDDGYSSQIPSRGGSVVSAELGYHGHEGYTYKGPYVGGGGGHGASFYRGREIGRKASPASTMTSSSGRDSTYGSRHGTPSVAPSYYTSSSAASSSDNGFWDGSNASSVLTVSSSTAPSRPGSGFNFSRPIDPKRLKQQPQQQQTQTQPVYASVLSQSPASFSRPTMEVAGSGTQGGSGDGRRRGSVATTLAGASKVLLQTIDEGQDAQHVSPASAGTGSGSKVPSVSGPTVVGTSTPNVGMNPPAQVTAVQQQQQATPKAQRPPTTMGEQARRIKYLQNLADEEDRKARETPTSYDPNARKPGGKPRYIHPTPQQLAKNLRKGPYVHPRLQHTSMDDPDQHSVADRRTEMADVNTQETVHLDAQGTAVRVTQEPVAGGGESMRRYKDHHGEVLHAIPRRPGMGACIGNEWPVVVDKFHENERVRAALKKETERIETEVAPRVKGSVRRTGVITDDTMKQYTTAKLDEIEQNIRQEGMDRRNRAQINEGYRIRRDPRYKPEADLVVPYGPMQHLMGPNIAPAEGQRFRSKNEVDRELKSKKEAQERGRTTGKMKEDKLMRKWREGTRKASVSSATPSMTGATTASTVSEATTPTASDAPRTGTRKATPTTTTDTPKTTTATTTNKPTPSADPPRQKIQTLAQAQQLGAAHQAEAKKNRQEDTQRYWPEFTRSHLDKQAQSQQKQRDDKEKRTAKRRLFSGLFGIKKKVAMGFGAGKRGKNAGLAAAWG